MSPTAAHGGQSTTLKTPLIGPRAAFGVEMAKRALNRSARRRLAEGRKIALVLRVSRSELVDPLVDGLTQIASPWASIVAAQSSSFDTEDYDGLASISAGQPGIHVCVDLDHVPPIFRGAAEEVIDVPDPDAAILKRVLRQRLRGRLPFIPADIVITDLDMVCRCMATGAPARHAVDVILRICRADPPQNDVALLPDLKDCVEFGEARIWGLRVRDDLQAWKAGKLATGDLDLAVLLASPPGFGKTFFARVLARSLGATLHVMTIGKIFAKDSHLDSTLKEMRSVFAAAARTTPSVLLIDEADSFPARGSEDRNDYYSSALVNELLTLLDGVEQRAPGMVVIGATNLPQLVDPALLRPGRLSTTIRMELPGKEGIEQVLRHHLRGDLDDLELKRIAELATGNTPAGLMGMVRRARAEARALGRGLELGDLVRQASGGARRDPETDWIVCIHEAGHAAMALALRGGAELGPVRVGTEAGAAGMATLVRTTQAMSKPAFEDMVLFALGGRAAEEAVFGEAITTGAGGAMGSDLWRATTMIASIHANLGFGTTLAWRASDEGVQDLLHGDSAFRALVEAELQRFMEKARSIARSHLPAIVRLAERLRCDRVVSGPHALAILRSTSASETQLPSTNGSAASSAWRRLP